MPYDVKSPAWIAGYHAARQSPVGILSEISAPKKYTPKQCSDFTSGFIAGARDRQNDDLIDELIAAEEEANAT